MNKYTKLDWIVMVVAFLSGVLIIHLQPSGKLYHFIPVFAFWIFHMIKSLIKRTREEQKKEDA